MNKILLLVIAFISLLLYIKSNKTENFGTNFFHRGKLAEIGQAIQSQIEKSQAGIEQFKGTYSIDMKKEKLEKYDPNRNVISEYSFKEVKPEIKDATKIQIGDLASDDFATPDDYNNTKELAEYLEVDSYDAGSGSLNTLTEAYKMLNKEQYYQSLRALRIRGGNVSIYPTKDCKKDETDIIGFI